MVELFKEKLREIAGGSKWKIQSGLEGPRGFTMLPAGTEQVPKLRGDEQHVVHVLIPGLDITNKSHLEFITEAATTQRAAHMPNMLLAGKKGTADQLSSWVVFGQGPGSPALAITKIGTQGFVEFKAPKDFSDETRVKILAFFKKLKEKMEQENK